MNIFAGVFSLKKINNPSEKMGAIISLFNSKMGLKLTKTNINDNFVFYTEQPPHYSSSNSAISGQLLLSNSENEYNLVDELDEKERLFELLANSSGDFSGFKYFGDKQQLLLFTDKSGIRPLFYQKIKDRVFFSTNFQFFMLLNRRSLEFDPQAILEQIALGYSLSNRTVLSDVKRLDSAQCLIFGPSGSETFNYWNRKNIRLIKDVDKSHFDDLYDSFTRAVKKRITETNKAVAFLSGGLDSRVIVSQLVYEKLEVSAFNFGTKKSQDNEFARIFASKLNLNYFPTLLKELNFPNWSQLISDTMKENEFEYDDTINGKPVWSGDGGSVCAGAVYLNTEIQNAVQENNLEKALDIFFENQKIILPIKFLSSELRQIANSQFKKQVLENLSIDHNEKDKAFYDFLIKNDQKRHLDRHFETIHSHRIDLKLPFFDSDFMDNLYAFPVKELLFHKLYMKWFQRFPTAARSTPWQTYPGHEKCPIKVAKDYSYQWDNQHKSPNIQKDMDIYDNFKKTALFKKCFSPFRVRIAMLLHKHQIKKFGYLINMFRSLNE
ncbi:hypothetical protein KJ365_07130 [Glaciecola sp. XM2]|uniref:asparagine synthase-related protein n=1 Tax=Glaciecola sp. XM2 TaxID=1914931 RepID=UPI001BDE3798|nr:asparagine synthase-related protein [Glaciecola sp. XM2]MBT1450652.1 hypothetical protein [Glaciecola sp. XM2]